MSYQTVHDVLKQLQQQFASIASALDAAEVFATSDDAKSAIHAVREDEHRVAEAMGDSAADQHASGSNQTWLQFVPKERLNSAVEDLLDACHNGSTLEQLKQSKLEFDEAVQDFLSTLAEQARAPSVAERLKSLAEYFASRTRQDSWSLRSE